MKEFVISKKEAGQRMDKYLFKVLDQAPKSFVYKMLRKKNIVLNDKKATGQEVLSDSDNIKIYVSDETFEKFASKLPKADDSLKETSKKHAQKKNHAKIDVVYEDEDILIINKPAGMLSQKASPGDYSANEMIIDYLLDSNQLTTQELRTFRPSICNRLDRNTSGLLIAGKTIRGLQQMSEQLKSRSMQKYYRCLVLGNITKDAHLTGYLIKDHTANKVTVSREKPEKDADFIETAYHPIRQYKGMTLLEVHLITGRSHQIRAHLASIGHPILGDGKYGNEKINQKLRKQAGVSGQLLHAYRMEFPDGKVVKAIEPPIFSNVEKLFL
jgi:23S rRNA pseudouridine955/2504/2580 synthase